jgi:hypothetical protein
MELANKRNALIVSQQLQWEVISGDSRAWSWWYQLPPGTSTQTGGDRAGLGGVQRDVR